MGEIEAVQELLNLDYKQIILSIVILAVSLVVIKKFINEVIELFNIETPTMKKERKRKEEIQEIKTQLSQLKDSQEKLAQKSHEADERTDINITNIDARIKSLTVAIMRSSLWRIYMETTEKGYITQEGLKTFTECGKVYEEAGGDDIYHSKLFPEVMKLPVHEEFVEVSESDE